MHKLHKLNVNSPKLPIMQSYALALVGFVFENSSFISLLKFFSGSECLFCESGLFGFCFGFVWGFFASLPSILLFVRFNMANPTQKLLKEQRTFPIVKLDKRTHTNKISKST